MTQFVDRLYCPYHEWCKQGKTCDKALTKEVKKAAKDAGRLNSVQFHVAIPVCMEYQDKE